MRSIPPSSSATRATTATAFATTWRSEASNPSSRRDRTATRQSNTIGKPTSGATSSSDASIASSNSGASPPDTRKPRELTFRCYASQQRNSGSKPSTRPRGDRPNHENTVARYCGYCCPWIRSLAGQCCRYASQGGTLSPASALQLGLLCRNARPGRPCENSETAETGETRRDSPPDGEGSEKSENRKSSRGQRRRPGFEAGRRAAAFDFVSESAARVVRSREGGAGERRRMARQLHRWRRLRDQSLPRRVHDRDAILKGVELTARCLFRHRRFMRSPHFYELTNDS